MNLLACLLWRSHVPGISLEIFRNSSESSFEQKTQSNNNVFQPTAAATTTKKPADRK